MFVRIVFLLNPLVLFVTGRPIPEDRYGPISFFLGLALLQNWGFGNLPLAWNIPSWSIGAEWFAYLLFPMLSYLCISTVQRAIIAVEDILLANGLLVAVYYLVGIGSLGTTFLFGRS